MTSNGKRRQNHHLLCRPTRLKQDRTTRFAARYISVAAGWHAGYPLLYAYGLTAGRFVHSGSAGFCSSAPRVLLLDLGY